jgi:molybdopterin converting factor small subunit
MIRIRFTLLFAERIGGVQSVEVEAASVKAALCALTDRYPALERLVWTEGNINPVMAVFLNNRQLRAHELDTPVQAGDSIDIIPAISGG